MTEILCKPIADQSAWNGADMQNDRSWELHLSDSERGELENALAAVKAQSLTLARLSRSNFPLGPATQRLATHIINALKGGHGFTVIRGFPVKGHTDDDIRLMYFGLAQHMGTCVSQDPECALVADVKEKGINKDPLTRAYGSKHPTRLHVDLADVVGLLGVRQAPTGALSLLASSTAIYNEFVKQHPEWMPTAFEGFYWDRFGEHKEWEEPTSPTKIPLFSLADGQLSTRYNRSWINAAAVRRNVPFNDVEQAILDFFDDTARKLSLPIKMQPGDVYFANNYTVLHGRDSYEETADAPLEHKRLFLRVWFNIPEVRSFADEATIRFGLSNHGNIGWTSRELSEGKNLVAGHQRIRLEPTALTASAD
jgi:hypothetical protein